eukprot:CAMPEP_0115366000 /NCGR_PEP_ID=MMETSP0270-20121206/104577_1 /TAXON_ID=71861 /ORGANISM="Scrippsiella trochoidea, Strain CCMP3099" /LENGTH=225 /DNA_ID=CAMNT_0002788753 /DNA_START=69 /DNA_END=747 /DNA_ORIENTATION=-
MPLDRSLAIFPLDVARDVEEERDGQEERLHNVRNIEVVACRDLNPLRIIDVEHQVSVEPNAEEEESQEGKFVRTEGLQVANDIARELVVNEDGLARILGEDALQLVLMPVHGSLQVFGGVVRVNLLEQALVCRRLHVLGGHLLALGGCACGPPPLPPRRREPQGKAHVGTNRHTSNIGRPTPAAPDAPDDGNRKAAARRVAAKPAAPTAAAAAAAAKGDGRQTMA